MPKPNGGAVLRLFAGAAVAVPVAVSPRSRGNGWDRVEVDAGPC